MYNSDYKSYNGIDAIKQFNKDFFNFRDKYTYENSSMRPDAVDKVINLQLSGSLSKARGTSGRKITDIYDEVTGSIDYVDMSNVPDLDIHNCVVVDEDDFFDELALRQENNFNNLLPLITW